jgi:hypothetical protein
MSGIWKLPVKDVPVELMIFHPQNSKQYNTMAIIKLNPSCKKPVMMPLRGNVIKSGKDSVIVLESQSMPITKQCTFTFTLMATGKMNSKKFKAKGAVASTIKCKGKKPRVDVDMMDGFWVKKKMKKAKPKQTKGIRI